MNVVLIGSGGREHALALAISKSILLNDFYIIPGNPGTNSIGVNLSLDINNKKELVTFCKEKKIDLVVVGPEKPLIDGITDFLFENGIKVFGPSKNAARIEGEKSFAKELMRKYKIPTADYKVFKKNEYDKTITYLNKTNYPIVIKADGIAAGKGVVVADDFQSAKNAVDDCFVNNTFQDAGNKIVIEEFLTGQEVSVFAITDGKEFTLLPPAQDHKRIGEGDTGKNTGGMGAYAPTPFVNNKMLNRIAGSIISPTLTAMSEKGFNYVGCLYCGLIITDDGPKVIEFNCRFGDPETQVVLPLLDGDLLTLLNSAAEEKLNPGAVWYNDGASVCVVTASKGYPDAYEKGKLISGLDNINDEEIIVYHAGTIEKNGNLLTNGGRVLGVTSVIKENNLREAKQLVYTALEKIHFDGIYYRKDISDKALNQTES